MEASKTGRLDPKLAVPLEVNPLATQQLDRVRRVIIARDVEVPKIELVIQSHDEVRCQFCQYSVESSAHIAVTYPFSMDVWGVCYNWLGVLTVLPMSRRIICCSLALVGIKISRGAVRFGLFVWLIWLMRNEGVFKGGESDLQAVVDLIKWRSWHWVKAKFGGFAYSLFEWIPNPLDCLHSL